MSDFRVYNRVRKVGVTWRMSGVEFGKPSMALLATVTVTAVAAAGIAALVGLTAVAVALMFLGAIAFVFAFVAVSRLVAMGTLGEMTQLRLISDAMKHRRVMTFSTPDAAGDINDDNPHTESSSVYRNFDEIHAK